MDIPRTDFDLRMHFPYNEMAEWNLSWWKIRFLQIESLTGSYKNEKETFFDFWIFFGFMAITFQKPWIFYFFDVYILLNWLFSVGLQ